MVLSYTVRGVLWHILRTRLALRNSGRTILERASGLELKLADELAMEIL